MNMAFRIPWRRRDSVILWIVFGLALLSGIHVGGAVFDSVVNDPIWTASASAAREWDVEKINPGKFFGRFSPLLLLLSLTAFIAAWASRPRVRPWLLIATTLFMIAVAVTIAYFLPEIRQIRGPAAMAIPDDVLTERVARWARLDIVREIAVFIGFVLTVHALGLSYGERAASRRTPSSETEALSAQAPTDA